MVTLWVWSQFCHTLIPVCHCNDGIGLCEQDSCGDMGEPTVTRTLCLIIETFGHYATTYLCKPLTFILLLSENTVLISEQLARCGGMQVNSPKSLKKRRVMCYMHSGSLMPCHGCKKYIDSQNHLLVSMNYELLLVLKWPSSPQPPPPPCTTR